MQSDKLPKMPQQRWDVALHGEALYGVYDSAEVAADASIKIGGSATAIYTAQQMRDYALAARNLALEEVRAELNKRIDEMSRMERHRYLDGARGEAIAIELWLKELMEQDA